MNLPSDLSVINPMVYHGDCHRVKNKVSFHDVLSLGMVVCRVSAMSLHTLAK